MQLKCVVVGGLVTIEQYNTVHNATQVCVVVGELITIEQYNTVHCNSSVCGCWRTYNHRTIQYRTLQLSVCGCWRTYVLGSLGFTA